MSKDKIKRLKTYLQKVQDQVKSEGNVHKRAFFERELRKTESKIESLTKSA